ncbi:hypothetical protein RRG08_062579 [Elysia crispata]|uniref:Uncharacterized protein n=1 Tax=Elysia crispata TaxID=231223 RepID=A0AAE1ANC6_9GAST|nr:hypothetical protein RRG08_062579 [Elysia crispata]
MTIISYNLSCRQGETLLFRIHGSSRTFERCVPKSSEFFLDSQSPMRRYSRERCPGMSLRKKKLLGLP